MFITSKSVESLVTLNTTSPRELYVSHRFLREQLDKEQSYSRVESNNSQLCKESKWRVSYLLCNYDEFIFLIGIVFLCQSNFTEKNFETPFHMWGAVQDDLWLFDMNLWKFRRESNITFPALNCHIPLFVSTFFVYSDWVFNFDVSFLLIKKSSTRLQTFMRRVSDLNWENKQRKTSQILYYFRSQESRISPCGEHGCFYNVIL